MASSWPLQVGRSVVSSSFPFRVVAAATATTTRRTSSTIRTPPSQSPTAVPRRLYGNDRQTSVHHDDDDDDKDKDDPHDIYERFIVTHQAHFTTALEEIRTGRKRSHWSWFIFPTPPFYRDGVEVGSGTNRYYALRSDEQAKAFLEYPTTTTTTADDGRKINLRDDYLTIMTAVAEPLERRGDDGGVTPLELVGSTDVSKLRSSLGYFEYVATHVMDPPDTELRRVCQRTLRAMAAASERQ